MNKQFLSKLTTKTATIFITAMFLCASVAFAPSSANAAMGDILTIYPRNWTVLNGPASIVSDRGGRSLRLKSTKGNQTEVYSGKVQKFYMNNLGKRVRICVYQRANSTHGFIRATTHGAKADLWEVADYDHYTQLCLKGRIVTDPSSEKDFGKFTFETGTTSSKTRIDYLRKVTIKVLN